MFSIHSLLIPFWSLLSLWLLFRPSLPISYTLAFMLLMTAGARTFCIQLQLLVALGLLCDPSSALLLFVFTQLFVFMWQSWLILWSTVCAHYILSLLILGICQVQISTLFEDKTIMACPLVSTFGLCFYSTIHAWCDVSSSWKYEDGMFAMLLTRSDSIEQRGKGNTGRIECVNCFMILLPSRRLPIIAITEKAWPGSAPNAGYWVDNWIRRSSLFDLRASVEETDKRLTIRGGNNREKKHDGGKAKGSRVAMDLLDFCHMLSCRI